VVSKFLYVLAGLILLQSVSIPYGNIDEDESAIYEPKKGWILMPGIGTSGGENNYGFNSPYICLDIALMHSIDEGGYVQAGFGATYYRCKRYDQFYEYHEIVFNNRKQELCTTGRLYFFILPRDRITPYLGVGGGLFYVSASGRYVKETRYYTYDTWSHKWVYESVETFNNTSVKSILGGITMHFGMKILVNSRVDLHIHLLQTLSLWRISNDVPVIVERWDENGGEEPEIHLSEEEHRFGDEKVNVVYPYIVPANDTMVMMYFGFVL